MWVLDHNQQAGDVGSRHSVFGGSFDGMVAEASSGELRRNEMMVDDSGNIGLCK